MRNKQYEELAEKIAEMGQPKATSPPTLLLRSRSGNTTVKATTDASLTPYSATFAIPKSIPEGLHEVWVSNNLAPTRFTKMEAFLNAKTPTWSEILIKPSRPLPDKIFDITKYGACVPVFGAPTCWCDANKVSLAVLFTKLTAHRGCRSCCCRCVHCRWWSSLLSSWAMVDQWIHCGACIYNSQR